MPLLHVSTFLFPCLVLTVIAGMLNFGCGYIHLFFFFILLCLGRVYYFRLYCMYKYKNELNKAEREVTAATATGNSNHPLTNN